MVKFFLTVLILIGLTLGFVPAAIAAEVPHGAEIFELHCAGCHLNGGNIVRRGKTLKQKALEKNGVASLEAIAELVTQGKNNMSAYRDRLTPEEIQQVAAYVLERAEQNWVVLKK
jgi:cytochrome c6